MVRNNPVQHGLLLVLLLAVSITTPAQKSPFDTWHEGKIVLTSADTLTGLVRYDLRQDLVHFTDRRNNAVYTAQKVLFFEIFDVSLTGYRTFFALPYSTATGYRTPVFFELLEDGKLTLLSREYFEERRYHSPHMMGSYSVQVVVDRFYFFTERGEVEEFSGNRNDLFRRMGSRSSDVEEFVRQNRLRLDEKPDLRRAVAFYNSLFDP